MAKAADARINSHPDAAIFLMGDRLAELERQCLEFDSASGRFSEASEADSRSDEAGRAHSDLEWELIHTPAATLEGHSEKIRILESGGLCFDPDVLAEVMWLLGHEAGRLGLSNAIPNQYKRIFAASAAPDRKRHQSNRTLLPNVAIDQVLGTGASMARPHDADRSCHSRRRSRSWH
jgi:hypothetical protein